MPDIGDLRNDIAILQSMLDHVNTARDECRRRQDQSKLVDTKDALSRLADYIDDAINDELLPTLRIMDDDLEREMAANGQFGVGA